MRILMYFVELYCVLFAEAVIRNCSYPQNIPDQKDLDVYPCKNNAPVCEIQYDSPRIVAATKFTATEDTTKDDLKCEATFYYPQESEFHQAVSFDLSCYVGQQDKIDSAGINLTVPPIAKNETRFIACDCENTDKHDKDGTGNIVFKLLVRGQEECCYFVQAKMSKEKPYYDESF